MNPFIGQILSFGGNFAPRGWAFCNGQLLSIAENTALFSILGTTYGGDGRTTFGLPELRGRVPMHPGNGPGLSPKRLGDKSGLEQNHLNILTMASHTHLATVGGSVSIQVSDQTKDEDSPSGTFLTSQDDSFYASAGSPGETLGGPIAQITVGNQNTGSGQGINNIAPYTAINYIIALVGTYPSRS